jgi:hypothetical protein
MATILNTNLVYDPRYHTFESWASLMCELYAVQQLAIPDANTDWKEWASGLKAIDVFTNEGIPAPSSTTTGKNGLKLLSTLLTHL